MPFPVLPPEILECIMYSLKGDNSSLKSCSLVCLAWFYASRPPLFHTLTIDSSNSKAFFNHFHIIPLPPCTAYCTTLHLVRTEWLFIIDGEAYKEFVLHFSDALVSLSISHTVCPSISHLLMAIGPLYKLRALSLAHFRLEQQASDTHLYPTDKTQSINTLCLHNTNLRYFLSMVNLSKTFQNITKLDMDILTEGDFPEAGQFLLGRAVLQELSLSFSDKLRVCSIPSAVAMVEQLSDKKSLSLNDHYLRRFGLPTSPFLHALTSLEVIRIRMFLDSRRSEQNTALIWVPKTLSSTTAPTLRRVILTLYLERAGLIDQYDVDWRFLDHILNCQNYLELESITFENFGPANIQSLQDLVSARLPRTANRGILRFC